MARKVVQVRRTVAVPTTKAARVAARTTVVTTTSKAKAAGSKVRMRGAKVGRARPGGIQTLGSDMAIRFAKAVLDPLSDVRRGFMGIPDGYAGTTLKTCFRTVVTITPDSSGLITLCVLPTYPAQLWVFAGQVGWTSTPGASGMGTLHSYAASGGTPTSSQDWYGIPCASAAGEVDRALQTAKGVITSGTANPVLINAVTQFNKMRFAGIGLSVKPTGGLATVTGQAALARGSFRLGHDVGLLETAPAIHQFPFRYLSGIPHRLQQVAGMPEAKTCAVIDGAISAAVGDQTDDRWDFSEVVQQTFAQLKSPAAANRFVNQYDNVWLSDVTMTGMSAFVTNQAFAARPLGNNFYIPDQVFPEDTPSDATAGTIFVTDQLGYMVYTAQGLPANFPLEVEVCATAEATTAPNSSYREFTTHALPLDENLLEVVAQAQAQLPVCADYRDNMSGAWSNMVLNILKGGLSFLGRLRIPVVSSASKLSVEIGKMLNLWPVN